MLLAVALLVYNDINRRAPKGVGADELAICFL